jgi:hypothetical protein
VIPSVRIPAKRCFRYLQRVDVDFRSGGEDTVADRLHLRMTFETLETRLFRDRGRKIHHGLSHMGQAMFRWVIEIPTGARLRPKGVTNALWPNCHSTVMTGHLPPSRTPTPARSRQAIGGDTTGPTAAVMARQLPVGTHPRAPSPQPPPTHTPGRGVFADRRRRPCRASPQAVPIAEPSPRMTAVILQLFVSGPHA